MLATSDFPILQCATTTSILDPNSTFDSCLIAVLSAAKATFANHLTVKHFALSLPRFLQALDSM